MRLIIIEIPICWACGAPYFGYADPLCPQCRGKQQTIEPQKQLELVECIEPQDLLEMDVP